LITAASRWRAAEGWGKDAREKEYNVRLLKTDNRKLRTCDLQVASAYQRTIVAAQVRRIAKALDPDAFGSLTVGERADGSLWVVDGLQRLTAARQLVIEAVPCDVFSSTGPEHEARVFRLKNKHRTNVSALALFRAQLTEGDPQSVEIARVIRDAGLRLVLSEGGKNSWPDVKAVRSVERAYSRVGADGLAAVFRILSESWAGERDALQGDMIEGMSVFVKRHPEFKESRLVDKLRTRSVAGVLRAADATYKLARDRDSSHHGRSLATYDAILIVYNKGLRRERLKV
jgi:hypothetical protein